MIRRQKMWIRVVLMLLFCLVGCSLPSKVVQPESQFVRAQDDFMQRLRWKDYQGAAKHFTEPLQDGFLQQFRNADQLNVTDVSLQHAKYLAETEQMESEVAVEYFLLPSATVKTFCFEQQWTYFRSGEKLTGEWRITSLFPQFPGLESP
ncbi:MAG TPA: hypothetical protein VJ995_00980 [Geothermobacteraceae bacterium]|nr:hypothetical protein [Geothermobacteraceae bacterium]